MRVDVRPHAAERIKERGISLEELLDTIERGEHFEAKYGRIGFRGRFPFQGGGAARSLAPSRSKAIGVREADSIVVITVLAKYY